MVILRAFRAIDEPDSCQKFIEGHERVLTSIGINKVTSSKEDWMYNPAAFVIVVEDPETGEVQGGARIHAYGGNQLLPIEEATAYIDPNISVLLKDYARQGTGEICGLWNSRKIAGMGFGSIYLNRAAVAISSQMGLNSIFALCAPYTVDPALSFGYEIVDSVGEDGKFYYPKLDLIATVMVLKDAVNMPLAKPEQRDRVQFIRQNLDQRVTEAEAHKEVEIEYDLTLKNIAKNEFKV